MNLHSRFRVRKQPNLRDWRKFLNKQKYSECQLVTAINARYWLTGKILGQDTQHYEKLVDLVGARHGAAISVHRAWKRFGIDVAQEYNYVFGIEADMLPLELTVWHKAYGYHSVLIIDREARSGAVRIANFSKATSMYGWIFWEDLQHFLQKSLGRRSWRARKFKLVKG